ncbi:MAG: ABC transporter permease [Chloroflexota bacterium]|nr:ABC transporter permease [Chloroflexota bacterium]
MTNKTLTVIKHEFTQTIKRKGFIITTLSIPLLAMLSLFTYQVVQNIDTVSDEPEEQQIGYVDNTGLFADFTERPGDFTFIHYPNETNARGDLIAEEIDEYFIIPADYLASGQITRYITENELEPSGAIWWQMKDFLQSNLLDEEVSNELFYRVKEPLNLTSLQLDKTGTVSETRNPLIVMFVPYVFGLLFMLSIFFTSGYLLQSVTEEKENRIIEVLLSSVSSRQLLLGKILGLGSAGLVQIVVWLATLWIFSEVASVNIPVLSDLAIPTGMLIFGVVYFILGYLLFAILYAGLGSIGSTARESQQWTVMFAMPAALPLMLLAIIGEHPDGIVARVLTFIPITAPTTVMMRLPNATIPAWELLLSLLLLGGSIALGIWAVAKIFRVYLLMYGKRPAFKEILKYVRES